ncbi:MAG: hypothetical protein JST67_01790 [Bacteroidetes bacterium]|nr:hypothetical protein [Bacteroidota bacterium]
MKKHLYFLSVLFLLFSFKKETPKQTTAQTDVWICGPHGAKRFHFDKNCQGLKSCTRDLYKVSLREAQAGLALTICGYEDGHGNGN